MGTINLIFKILMIVIEIIRVVGAARAHSEIAQVKEKCEEMCKAELKEQSHRGGNGPI